MVLECFSERLQSSSYSQINPKDYDQESLEKNDEDHHSGFQKTQRWYLLLSAIFIALAGIAGYLVGSNSRRGELAFHSTNTGIKVSIASSTSVFQYNSSFAAPPPKGISSEPIWDSMIPNGLGYIKDPTIATETSILSVFHQLHCLYTVRRAFYSNTETDGVLEAFDLGKERKPHVAHCFDYLRQGILCSADSTIEPGVDTMNGFLGAGFPRQCRDFQQLKNWAEAHRAFDAHGFLVDMEHA